MVVFGQSACFRAKRFYLGKISCIRVIWLYSGEDLLFGQIGCISAKIGFIRAKHLYSGKVVVFGQKWLLPGKVVVFRQNLFYLCT